MTELTVVLDSRVTCSSAIQLPCSFLLVSMYTCFCKQVLEFSQQNHQFKESSMIFNDTRQAVETTQVFPNKLHSPHPTMQYI